MKNNKINKVFKQVFKSFMKNEIGVSEFFIKQIDSCDTYGDFKKCLETNVDIIALRLGYECEECENIQDKLDDTEDEVRYLTRENLKLDDKLYVSFTPKTFWDEQKLRVFMDKKDNFTPEDFESLLD